MRVAFSGPRDLYVTKEVLEGVIEWSGFKITQVLVGDARGIDECVRIYAKDRYPIVTTYKADWKGEGRAAGPKRTDRMLDSAEAFIAIRDQRRTKGTGYAVESAIFKRNLPFHVEEVPSHQLLNGKFVAVERYQ